MRAQLLDATRFDDLLAVMRRLTVVQVDGTKPIAPSADLVLWSRLGNAYRPADLDAAQVARQVVDMEGFLRPGEDVALYRAEMAAWPGVGEIRNYLVTQGKWVEANDGCRRDLLRRLREYGPLPSKELPDTCAKPWASSGWNNNRNVTMLLEMMERRGEVAVAGREGRNRLWDLAERVYPDTPTVPLAEAITRRNERRLQSLGLARSRGPECPVEPNDVGEAGEPAVVEGVNGEWRVDPAQLGREFAGRAALLSPFDRLIADRARMHDLFEFEYALEMYKPAPKRRWGYYALPILFEDRLVGKLDAAFERKANKLRVRAVHEDVPFSRSMAEAIDAEIAELADWLEHQDLIVGE